jgi:hypothetical protein
VTGTDVETLIRAIVEKCWSNAAGLDRMEALVAPGYVHHAVVGDLDFDGFRRVLRGSTQC